MIFKRILIALALLLAPSLAYGQCSGVFATGKVCGNFSGVSAPPSAVTLPSPAPPVILNTITSPQFGLWTFGDSVTAGSGATTPSSKGYVGLMGVDFVTNLAPTTNNAINGYAVADGNAQFFGLANPQDANNPIITVMLGINDASGFSTTGYSASFTQLISAIAARGSLSATNTIAGNSAQVTQAGTWTNDTSYAHLTGIKSTTNGSTASASIISTNGILYLYYGDYVSSGGAFTVTIDGVAAIDTITNSTNLKSQPTVAYITTAPVTRAVALARFVTTPGTHSVVVTVTSATSASNPVAILGFAVPPAIKARGATAPKIFVGGVIYQNNDANSANTAAANTAVQNAVATLNTDGSNVVFVNVRNYINSTLDMTGSATQNCPASLAPGFHPNDCGHIHLSQAFEDSINPTSTASNPASNLNYGPGSLSSITTGQLNTAYGSTALRSTTTGQLNAAFGLGALQGNTTGSSNTASGLQALLGNTTGNNNTAVGYVALSTQTTAANNTAVGASALALNTAPGNDAFGAGALSQNTTGQNNNGFGAASLASNVTGSFNTAVGSAALEKVTTGSNNVGIGYIAGGIASGGSGGDNIYVGYESAFAVTSGARNNIFGSTAAPSLTTGTDNIMIGYATGNGITTGSNNTIVGGNVAGLSANLANNIILADGQGNIKGRWDGSSWSFKGISITGASSVTAVSHTGDTVETILATIAVPALPAGVRLRLTTDVSYSGANSTRTIRIYYGATSSGTGGTLYTTAASTATVLSGRFKTQINNRTTSSQYGAATNLVNDNSSSSASVTSAITTTGATEINITGQLANSGDTFTLEGYVLEIIAP